MSFQWTFIAGYLYFEISIVIIIILPIFSPRAWYTFFHSRLFSVLREQAAIYFYVLLGVLGLFLCDAIREMRKYSHSTESGGNAHLASELKGNVKLFRAQRNFYITGFAIFLAFVIRRLVTMIIIQHELQLKANNIIKKADETVNLAKKTVLAHALENETETAQEIERMKNEILLKDDLIEEQKRRIKELEEEAVVLRAQLGGSPRGDGVQ